MLKYVAILILTVVFIAGCVSVKYEGQTYPATSGVKLFEDRTLIPEDYVDVGSCVAYGRRDNFTKAQICEKLRAKAEAVGADVVYIYAHQVVPESVVTGAVERVWNDSTSDTLWYSMERDFASYGQIGKDTTSAHSHSSYMRVIRAKFLKDPANVTDSTGTVSGKLEAISLDPQPVAAPAVEETAKPVEQPAEEIAKDEKPVEVPPAVVEDEKPVEVPPAVVEELKPAEVAPVAEEAKPVEAAPPPVVEEAKPVETPVVEDAKPVEAAPAPVVEEAKPVEVAPVEKSKPVDVKVEKPVESAAAAVAE